MLKLKLYAALLLIGLWVGLPTNVMAKGVFEHQNTFVPANQTVDDVVVVGGDATLSGTVNDSVILFNGNLSLTSTAQIHGFVLVIGGTITQEQGAVVADEILNFSLDNATQNSLLIGGGLAAGVWLLQLAASVLLVLLTILTVLIGKKRIHAFAERTRQQTGRMLYVGFFSCLILIALSVLLTLTIIGIPLVLFMVLILLPIFVVGFAALSIQVGQSIQRLAGRPDWLVASAGTVVLVCFMNVPLIGAVVFLGIVVFSVGATVMWLFAKFRKRK